MGKQIRLLGQISDGNQCLLSLDPEVRPTVIQWLKKGFTAAFYQNSVMDSAAMGHVAVLKIGKGCTFKKAPAQYPDGTPVGPGWKYVLVKELFYSNPADVPSKVIDDLDDDFDDNPDSFIFLPAPKHI